MSEMIVRSAVLKENKNIIVEKILKFCFANCFEYTTLINFVLLYIGVGLYAEGIRHILFVSMAIVIFCIALIAFVIGFKITELPRRTKIIYVWFVVIYIYGFMTPFFDKKCVPLREEHKGNIWNKIGEQKSG